VAERAHVEPDRVHEVLGRHLLVDGFRLVIDLERSRGSRVIDARTGRSYLDLYAFFSSAPLGVSPPELVDDPAFLAELARVAVNKPANSDMYTTTYAEFVQTFVRVLGDPALPHLFFVEGGALAVENALKTAFDWKSRHNQAHGRSRSLGTKVMHLTHAFHGRSGYTLSLTNTDPVKTDRFPTFGWPRITAPMITFPLHDHLDAVLAAEQQAISQAQQAFRDNPDDIAAFIAEPIQGEGGDNHFRPEFFQAMARLVHDHDALMIFDEVQTGVGTTGTPWAYQQLGVTPDIVAFGKKAQLGGIMAGGRVDEVPDNVFAVPGRLNSTWGGGLVDMVRSRRILEIIEAEGLVEAAGSKGRHLLRSLEAATASCPGWVSNARGRGLLAAIDLPSGADRDAVLEDLRENEGVLAFGCGERTIRLRPALSVSLADLTEAASAIGRSACRVRDRSAVVD
jgi:L-lysine 6-transaminase